MNLRPKIPIERRRRNKLQDVLEVPGQAPTPLRRESDRVKARLRRWIDLADKALGRARTPHSRQSSQPSSEFSNPDI